MSEQAAPKKRPARADTARRQTQQTLAMEQTRRAVVRRTHHERMRPSAVVAEMKAMRHRAHVHRARVMKVESLRETALFIDELYEALGIWRASYPEAERLAAVDAEYAKSEARERLYAEALLLVNDRLPPAPEAD